GAHGTEYVSIIAIEKLIDALDPAQVTGIVILVPLINVQSFEQKVPHVNPIDNKSMNRFYPGKADRTQTDRASFHVTKEIVNGTLSTMRALKMLPGDPHPIENPVWIEKLVDVLADGPGIWYPLVKRGTYVSAGMKLGAITDYTGKLIAEPRAPVSAVVLHVNAVPSLKKGDNIADLCVPAAKAP